MLCLHVVGDGRDQAGHGAAGRLVIPDVDAPALHTRYRLFHPRERAMAPAARVVVDALHRVEAELAAGLAAPAAAHYAA